MKESARLGVKSGLGAVQVSLIATFAAATIALRFMGLKIVLYPPVGIVLAEIPALFCLAFSGMIGGAIAGLAYGVFSSVPIFSIPSALLSMGLTGECVNRLGAKALFVYPFLAPIIYQLVFLPTQLSLPLAAQLVMIGTGILARIPTTIIVYAVTKMVAARVELPSPISLIRHP